MKRWLAYWMYDAIEILKKVNVWNSMENSLLNTWGECTAVLTHRDPCNVSQSGRFSLTRAGRTWWFDCISYLWAFEPNILNRIASFKRSLTHLLPSLAILQILMISISLDVAKTWKFHRLPAKFSNLGFKLVNLTSIYLLSLFHIIIRICLADFLKTSLTKFAVIWVKKRQKAGFLSPRSSKIIVTKEKERRKRKSEEKERRRRKKKQWLHP